jgi:uncharacterized repeat protein (TIGR01451 family)
MPGANLTYSINVTNHGPDDATGVITTDQLPAEVAFLSANASSGNTSYDGAFNSVYWDVGTLAINQTESLNITVAVGPTLPPDWGGFTTPYLFNTASVGADQADSETNNNQVTVNTTVIQPMVDLAIAKSDDPDPVMPGANLTYSINVTNNEVPFGLWPGTDVIVGPTAATGVITTDQLPQEVAFLSANASSGNTSYDGAFHTVYWDVGTLAINQTESLNITVAVGPNQPPDWGGFTTPNIFNQASVGTSNELETEFNNNQTTVNTTVIQPMIDLAIAKSDDPDPVMPGANLTYSINVTNNEVPFGLWPGTDVIVGPTAATGVITTDQLPQEVAFLSANASSGNTSYDGAFHTVYWDVGTLAINQTESLNITVAVGPQAANLTIFNQASVGTSNELETEFNNNQTTVNTTVIAPPGADLEITKSDSPESIIAGGNLTYTVTVTNSLCIRKLYQRLKRLNQRIPAKYKWIPTGHGQLVRGRPGRQCLGQPHYRHYYQQNDDVVPDHAQLHVSKHHSRQHHQCGQRDGRRV